MDVNVIIGIVTVLIAGGALGFTIWRGMETRKHNRLLVKPHLALINNITERGNKRFINFQLENCGTGQAMIKNFILEFNGKEIARNDIKKYETFLTSNTSGLKFSNISFLSSRTAIKAGNISNLWEFEYECGEREHKFIGGLNVRIEYQSIYKDEVFVCNSRRDLNGTDAALPRDAAPVILG